MIFLFLGRCPSTFQPVFPMLVFRLSKQLSPSRARTTFADFCNPQGGKSTDFSGGKCHLLARPLCRNVSGIFALTLKPCFFGKARVFPQKSKGFSLRAEPLKSLEKRGKTHKKAREIGKRKKARKSAPFLNGLFSNGFSRGKTAP